MNLRFVAQNKRSKNILIGVIAGIAVICGGLLLASYLEDAGCRMDIVKVQASPDGNYVARAIIKDCGATTGFSPQVRIRRVGIPFSERKAFWGYKTRDIDFKWNGNSQLNIYSDCKKENVFLLRKNVYSVDIKSSDATSSAANKD